MSNLNQVTLLGRVGQDPTEKTFDNGNKILNLSIATSEKYKDQNGEKKEITDWHNIQLGNHLSHIFKYISKGDMLLIVGKNKTRSWEKDGVKHYQGYVQAQSIQLFPKTKVADTQGGNTYTGQPPMAPSNEGDDDNPF